MEDLVRRLVEIENDDTIPTGKFLPKAHQLVADAIDCARWEMFTEENFVNVNAIRILRSAGFHTYTQNFTKDGTPTVIIETMKGLMILI